MKKTLFLTLALVLVLGLAASTVFAGGGKVRGCNGQGDVNQYQVDAQTNIDFDCN